ncbi:ribonuclease E inhibitor RraB [Actinoallomurus sp. NPDC052308]|uniref:ribonuclease E inhibitor RraB n=1 Tax=Actinoallomurus sp. NPDC052308 TaxID=3155530 RepID=UPI003426A983
MATISYTHWAYFRDREAAEACRRDLADYVVRIRRSAADERQWLLLAGRDVEVDRLPERHTEVEEIVLRHGGEYDGGETAYSPTTGGSVPDPMLTEDEDRSG